MEQQRLLRLHFLWLTIGLLLVSLVVYFSLSPKPPINLHAIKFGDKFSHVFAYGVLMGWFAQLYRTRLQRAGILAALIGLGILLEFLQGYGGIRTWSIADMAANTLGAALMFFATRGIYGQLLHQLENHFFASTNPRN